MFQGFQTLVPTQATVHALTTLVDQLHHSLALTTIASQVLTQLHPTRSSGTPPTSCGMARAVTMVVDAAFLVMHRGSGSS